jgi:hypothetical protein
MRNHFLVVAVLIGFASNSSYGMISSAIAVLCGDGLTGAVVASGVMKKIDPQVKAQLTENYPTITKMAEKDASGVLKIAPFALPLGVCLSTSARWALAKNAFPRKAVFGLLPLNATLLLAGYIAKAYKTDEGVVEVNKLLSDAKKSLSDALHNKR